MPSRLRSPEQARPPSAASADGAWERYRDNVELLRRRYLALPQDEPIRLAKRTSNVFRARRPTGGGLDVSAFCGVIAIDAEHRLADVGAMTTYEDLVDATLPVGLMPLVVPELRTITIGGAVTGLGIESSSWRQGLVHESMLELDVLSGDGQVVTATAEGEHAPLFFGFPNSYGSLGYALRVRVELAETRPFVHLRHLPFDSVDALADALRDVCASGSWEAEDVAFVDGTVFSAGECYLSLGSWADRAPWTSDYSGQAIYYQSIRRLREDWLTIADYLWRWDTDWFWCSRAFGVQHPWLRRLFPRRWLRSDTYWKLKAFEDRYRIKATLDRRLGRPAREDVIQDVEIPVDRLAEFLDSVASRLGISPVWLCPLAVRDDQRRWPLYPLDPDTLYVNVGFWSSVPVSAGDTSAHNRWVEDEVERLGGAKSLYSWSSYDRDRFERLYGGATYQVLKAKYDPGGRLASLYDKCVAGQEEQRP